MVAADDEQAWICRVRDGDPEAYGVLVERYQQRIFRLVAKWLGPDHAGIEDVTQDVFVRAYTALDTFRGDASFSTWLTRIALNRCRDEHRRAVSRRALQKVFARESAAVLESAAQTLEEPPDTSEETGQMVHLVVASLPDKLRLVVTLKDRLTRSLELSVDQQVEVRRILKATRAELGTLRRNMRQEVHAVLASSERQIIEVLKPDQRDAFRTLMAEHRARRHRWFKRHHQGQSPPPPAPQN